MNRVEFMRQLERLLQNVAATEREEAIQYYNDYFDDAGAENEQDVIEALGNPARVAENIKRDLIGNGYGEPQSRKVEASDRALIKYGDKNADDKENIESGADEYMAEGMGLNTADTGEGGMPDADAVGDKGLNIEAGTEEGRRPDAGAGAIEGMGWNTSSTIGEGVKEDVSAGTIENKESYRNGEIGGTDSFRNWETPPHYHETEREPEPHEGMPAWAVALLATILVLMSPAIFGLAVALISVVFTLFVVWCSIVFAFGALAVVLLLLLVVLVVVGVICCFADPWVGMAMMGGGLICGAVGLVFLMLTVAMAGIITPAICRGISSLFRIFRKRSVKRHARRAV